MYFTVIILLLFPLNVFANEADKLLNISSSWVGIVSIVLFIIGYLVIALEDFFKIDKAKPALFLGTFIYILIAIYYSINDLDMKIVHLNAEHLVLEIAEIFFFLYVAMIYIESMIHMGIFDRLKYNLISKGYSYKKIFWLTGFLSFFISPIADNLTTSLILSTVLMTMDKNNKKFLVPGAINIVVAANAGGAWSPFGDITTLMVWTNEKGQFIDFLYLFPSAFIGYIVTAYLLSTVVPCSRPEFNSDLENCPVLLNGAMTIVFLGVVTILLAIFSHQVLNLPPMWGMMFGLSILKIYSYNLKIKNGDNHFNIFNAISKIENNTLLFLFGILAAVGGLYFVGWLDIAVQIYNPDILGPTLANISIGFLSAIVDNVPVMSAILKSNPEMGLEQWMLVTLTTGIGGSLISFGSAAGVGVMGKLHGIYTFSSHIRYSWMILIGYVSSIVIWYLQYIIFSIGVWLKKVAKYLVTFFI